MPSNETERAVYDIMSLGTAHGLHPDTLLSTLGYDTDDWETIGSRLVSGFEMPGVDMAAFETVGDVYNHVSRWLVLKGEYLTPEKVADRVVNIVAGYTRRSADAVEKENDLESLGCDSLDRIELIMEVGEAFSITVPDEALERLNTVDSIVEYVNDRLGLEDSKK